MIDLESLEKKYDVSFLDVLEVIRAQPEGYKEFFSKVKELNPDFTCIERAFAFTSDLEFQAIIEAVEETDIKTEEMINEIYESKDAA